MRRLSSGKQALAGDGQHISAYDPALSEAILGETALLLRALGFAANHAILIGGLVPGLLVLDPGPGRAAHVGTTDVDICLSVALVKGETAEYERIEAALRRAGYAPTDQSFCWKRAAGLRLKVEFFCPAGENRPAGQLFRPKAAEAPTTKHNMGTTLSAIALEAGEAISADVQSVTRDVTLPEGGGIVSQPYRVTGIVGFLVAKTGALLGRDKPKDAYDIVWLLEAWPGGPEGAASSVQESPAFNRADVTTSLARLADAFATAGHVGPRSYARFTALSGVSTDDRARLAQQASGAVRAFSSAIDRHSHGRISPGGHQGTVDDDGG